MPTAVKMTITPPASRRRSLFAAAGAVIMGSGITSGVAASVADLVPAKPDAELIAACGRFCELEREFDIACLIDDQNGDDAQTCRIGAMTDALAEQMIAMPCTSLAGVQALARALAAWDRELLKDAPAYGMGELLTSHLVARLLALPAGGA